MKNGKKYKLNMEYNKEDFIFIQTIIRGGGIPGGDTKRIYDIYKKYIQPDIDNWGNKCYTCGNILPLFNKVKEYMNINKELFK